jgi:EAL domain-containing protein (putative c-di-GMP-specific phosphodiesterase class I)
MLGCPLGQGYLYGQPRPVHRLTPYVLPALPQHSNQRAQLTGRSFRTNELT